MVLDLRHLQVVHQERRKGRYTGSTGVCQTCHLYYVNTTFKAISMKFSTCAGCAALMCAISWDLVYSPYLQVFRWNMNKNIDIGVVNMITPLSILFVNNRCVISFLGARKISCKELEPLEQCIIGAMHNPFVGRETGKETTRYCEKEHKGLKIFCTQDRHTSNGS